MEERVRRAHRRLPVRRHPVLLRGRPGDRVGQAHPGRGQPASIHVGIPGLASLKALIGHARACGVGPSMRFLTRQARNVAKLLAVSAPDRLVTALAAYRATDPGCGIHGVHLYPLGGLKKSARWAQAVVDGRFEMREDGEGSRSMLRLTERGRESKPDRCINQRPVTLPVEPEAGSAKAHHSREARPPERRERESIPVDVVRAEVGGPASVKSPW